MRYFLALDLILVVAGYVCGAPPQAPIPPQVPAAVCPGGVCPMPVAYTPAVGTVCGPTGCYSVPPTQPYYTFAPQPRRGLFGWRRR